MEAPFLTATWRHLALLNFEADPRVLRPLVPAGTELDPWDGRHLVSVVGFLFLDTRVLGVPVPGHRDFEEVNLRFYVRRRVDGEWRRAVAFVREIVPRRAIAWTARALYGENYVAARMAHRIEPGPGDWPRAVAYSWWTGGREQRLELVPAGAPHPAAPGSEEQFVVEHEWGCARRRGGGTTEYRVEHPPWRLDTAASARLLGDLQAVYGAAFAECLRAPPSSAFLADGSRVAVRRGRRLAA